MGHRPRLAQGSSTGGIQGVSGIGIVASRALGRMTSDEELMSLRKRSEILELRKSLAQQEAALRTPPEVAKHDAVRYPPQPSVVQSHLAAMQAVLPPSTLEAVALRQPSASGPIGSSASGSFSPQPGKEPSGSSALGSVPPKPQDTDLISSMEVQAARAWSLNMARLQGKPPPADLIQDPLASALRNAESEVVSAAKTTTSAKLAAWRAYGLQLEEEAQQEGLAEEASHTVEHVQGKLCSSASGAGLEEAQTTMGHGMKSEEGAGNPSVTRVGVGALRAQVQALRLANSKLENEIQVNEVALAQRVENQAAQNAALKEEEVARGQEVARQAAVTQGLKEEGKGEEERAEAVWRIEVKALREQKEKLEEEVRAASHQAIVTCKEMAEAENGPVEKKRQESSEVELLTREMEAMRCSEMMQVEKQVAEMEILRSEAASYQQQLAKATEAGFLEEEEEEKEEEREEQGTRSEPDWSEGDCYSLIDLGRHRL